MWIWQASSGFLITNFDTFLMMIMLQRLLHKKTDQLGVLIAFLVSLFIMMGMAWLGLGFLQLWLETYVKPLFALIFLLFAAYTLIKKDKKLSFNESVPRTSLIRLVGFIVILNVIIGMDNILVYMGLFSGLKQQELAYTMMLHSALVVCLYGLSAVLVTQAKIQKILHNHHRFTVSVLFFFLSVSLLLR